MTRRKTDGQKIAERFYGYEIEKSVDYIDRLIRKRMAEAWGEGWFASNWDKKRVHENPYRGRSRKK